MTTVVVLVFSLPFRLGQLARGSPACRRLTGNQKTKEITVCIRFPLIRESNTNKTTVFISMFFVQGMNNK